MKRFLVLAGFEAGIATALLIMAVSRLANPVPAGDKNVSILRFCEGMRVVDVPVNEVDGVTGLTLAGMHVDVLISGKPPHWIRTLGIQTNTLLRNIEVLSAGPDFNEEHPVVWLLAAGSTSAPGADGEGDPRWSPVSPAIGFCWLAGSAGAAPVQQLRPAG